MPMGHSKRFTPGYNVRSKTPLERFEDIVAQHFVMAERMQDAWFTSQYLGVGITKDQAVKIIQKYARIQTDQSWVRK